MSKRRKPQHRNPAKGQREPQAAPFPAHLQSDEAYLEHLLTSAPEDLTSEQRQLVADIRTHHPEVP